MNPKAEQIRKRYLYRRLILSGDARISRETAKRMIGPDCAYQLYGTVQRERTAQRPKKKAVSSD